MIDDFSAEDAQRELMQRIQTEGVLAAYEAALSVCKDPKSPAPARATASATLFRVAGYFDRRSENGEKQPHEMTAAELSTAIDRAKRSLAGNGTGDIFE